MDNNSTPDWEQRRYEIALYILPLTLRLAASKSNRLVVNANREATDNAVELADLLIAALKGGKK